MGEKLLGEINETYIIAYDITSQKRAYRVRKLLYGYAFGGQRVF